MQKLKVEKFKDYWKKVTNPNEDNIKNILLNIIVLYHIIISLLNNITFYKFVFLIY